MSSVGHACAQVQHHAPTCAFEHVCVRECVRVWVRAPALLPHARASLELCPAYKCMFVRVHGSMQAPRLCRYGVFP